MQNTEYRIQSYSGIKKTGFGGTSAVSSRFPRLLACVTVHAVFYASSIAARMARVFEFECNPTTRSDNECFQTGAGNTGTRVSWRRFGWCHGLSRRTRMSSLYRDRVSPRAVSQSQPLGRCGAAQALRRMGDRKLSRSEAVDAGPGPGQQFNPTLEE